MQTTKLIVGYLRILNSLLVVLCLSACTENAVIHRLDDCSPGSALTNKTCTSIENHSNYKLGYVEFDDQGWFYDHHQMHRLLEELNTEAQDKDHDLLVVVFVHGWRHNAQDDDDNVKTFRDTLNLLASTEQLKEKHTRRKVFGIYIGWRGLSLSGLPAWEVLSFYERKKVADYVSKGSVRELFARLRHFAIHQNNQKSKLLKKSQENNTAAKASPKIRMVIMGHSFGGLIVYSAISPYLLYSSVVEPCTKNTPAESCEETKKWVDPFVDLVVLINPAFEASRYEALHHIAVDRRFRPGQKPVFIAVTTDNDWATRYAFPAGRWLNTILEDERQDAEQKAANKNTIGHVKRYRTHTLSSCDDALVTNSISNANACGCDGWKSTIAEPEQVPTAPRSGNGTALRLAKLEDNLEKEHTKAQAFRQRWQGKDDRLKPGWRRYFCGGLVLKHETDNENNDPETPFWVIYTDKSIIDGHGGFNKPPIRNFVHQLMVDLEDGIGDGQ